MTSERKLTLRELNRTTLARQLLLERADLSIPTALERLVGLQSQALPAPYIGLWTRLNGFTRADLSRLIHERAVVKATMMRATLHMVTATDYLRLRATLQPMLDQAFSGIAKGRVANVDLDTLLAEGRRFLDDQPRSFAEISAHFEQLFPDSDVASLRYRLRTTLPLVQAPTESAWSYPGNARFTLADRWIGQPIPDQVDFPALVRRYLAAFGPATVADFQTWSGFSKVKEQVEAMKPELVVYREDGGRGDLLDLPELPILDPDTPAPIRFLPEFDNLLLSHSKRTRVLADEHRAAIFSGANLRVSASILVDGFVAGVWKVEKVRKTAALIILPLVPLSPAAQTDITDEAERLIRFIEPDAAAFEVRFVEAL